MLQLAFSVRFPFTAVFLAGVSACHCSGSPAPAASAPAAAPNKPFVTSAHCPVVPLPVAIAGATDTVAGTEEESEDEQQVNAVAVAYAKAFAEKHYEEALACGQEFSRLAPDEVTGHLERATAFDALGKMNEAWAAYDRAIALDPTNPDTLLPAAKFLVRAGDNDSLETAVLYSRRGREAEQSVAKSAELAATEAEALNGIGRSEEALSAAETALALNADLSRALVERGVALFELLRFDEAERVFTEARMREPKNAKSFYYAGLLAERLNHAADAQRFLAEATRLNPDDYPSELNVTATEFQQIVDEQIAGLTTDQQKALRSTRFSWQDLPALDDLLAGDPVLSPTIVGIFRPGETGQPPAILLYRQNLLHIVRSREELRSEVRDTLLHELGHLGGEDDEELRDRGL